MDDENGELMELMEEVPLKELGDAELERLVRLSCTCTFSRYSRLFVESRRF